MNTYEPIYEHRLNVYTVVFVNIWAVASNRVLVDFYTASIVTYITNKSFYRALYTRLDA